MKGLESGKDKVKKICEVLKKETLEPAQHEADQIIATANAQAQKIIADAQAKAEALLLEGKNTLERQKNVFQSSMNQACKQSIEFLKQEIENKLFNHELSSMITKQMQDPKVIAEIISAVVAAIEKEGLETDITAFVPSVIPARNVNTMLAQNVISKLREKEVVLSSLQGGVAVKLQDQNITIDISDQAVKDLVSQFIRKDFRDL
ncbi:MAG: V-type ATP synthase subunit E, partial [Chlamydiae bacterium]|nr:V-type ATP synthase subunit E [Chlamydiota bacterium]